MRTGMAFRSVEDKVRSFYYFSKTMATIPCLSHMRLQSKREDSHAGAIHASFLRSFHDLAEKLIEQTTIASTRKE